MLRFQREFMTNALAPGVDTAVLSIPRGNGKTWIAGKLGIRALTPRSRLYVPGSTVLLVAGSLDQARLTFAYIRAELEPTGQYRFLDSQTRVGITHEASNTKLRVMSSDSKRAFGIVGCPLLLADEPGTWEVTGGQRMFDAIQTAQGKPGSPLRVVYVGTIAPSRAGWWPQLIERGSGGSTYVMALQGDPLRWDSWAEIARVNPLSRLRGSEGARFRKKLREELDEARRDTRLKARFLSLRMNVPSEDASSVLLTTDEWQMVCQRPVPEREGQPIVALDMGGGRAWSSAVALWRSGRVEALALAPGVPSIADQEGRDLVPAATYQRLVNRGVLSTDGSRRVPLASTLIDLTGGWDPAAFICDRFRVAEVYDAVGGRVPVLARVTMWSEAAEDIRALRRLALDGSLAVPDDSRDLLTVSLAASRVQNDQSGNTRLVKSDSNSCGRDDVAAALVLAAGALSRAPATPSVGHIVCRVV